MNNILFSKYGTFLSGRSLPKEIVAEAGLSRHSSVTLDFKGIPAANQSFLNQLFLELSALGFKREDLIIVNDETTALTSRINEQMNLVLGNGTQANAK